MRYSTIQIGMKKPRAWFEHATRPDRLSTDIEALTAASQHIQSQQNLVQLIQALIFQAQFTAFAPAIQRNG